MSEAIKQSAEMMARAEFALDKAKKLGADQAQVDIDASTGYSVTVRNRAVETVEYNRDHGLSLSVFCAGRKGSASVTDLSEQSIDDAVSAACAIAKHTSQDTYAGLCDPKLLGGEIPDLQLDHPWDLSVEDAINIGIACEEAMFATDKKITNTEGASVTTSRNLSCYANSHGFIHTYPQTSHAISALAIASDNGEMQRDYWYTVNRRADQLDDYASVAREAAQRAVKRLGTRKPNTAKVPVLFDAPVARGLFGCLIGAISGSVLYNKMSFLYDSLGKKVFPSHLRLYEQPHLLTAMGSAPFDGDGIITRNNTIVEQGMLQSYVLDSYAARKLGLETTANASGVHNLQVVSEEVGTQQALMQSMGRGLFITELIGQGINLITGDYSRGVAGFWVEDGVIQYPVEQVTIAGNLKDMFQGVVKIGDDVDRRGGIHCGSVLLEEMTLASA